MEERVCEILKKIDEQIINYEGDNLFEAGILDSFVVIDLVAELEDAFDLEIDAGYVVEENFRTKHNIIAFMRNLTDQI